MALLSRNEVGRFWVQDCRTFPLPEHTCLSDVRHTLKLRGPDNEDMVHPGRKDTGGELQSPGKGLGI